MTLHTRTSRTLASRAWASSPLPVGLSGRSPDLTEPMADRPSSDSLVTPCEGKDQGWGVKRLVCMFGGV